MEVFAAEIAGNIKEEGANYPKTIIFCRTYQACSMLYLQLKHLLGQFFTQPCGYPDLRVVDMYTKASLPHMKEKVLATFSHRKYTLNCYCHISFQYGY